MKNLLVPVMIGGLLFGCALTACNNKEEAARARQKRYFGSWDKELEASKKKNQNQKPVQMFYEREIKQ